MSARFLPISHLKKIVCWIYSFNNENSLCQISFESLKLAINAKEILKFKISSSF